MEQQLEAVYESVLVHLPAQELHRSCNGVLQEEFASVVATVDHLVEAFAKLEEVYDAVSRLQRGHKSTGGCSASLMEATARLIALQQELEQRVAALARQMAVERLSERKRKREEAVGGPQPSPKVQAKVADMNVSEANGRCEFSSKNASEASVSSKSDGDSGDDKDKGDTEATMMKKVAEQNALAAVSKIRNEAISTDASATTGGSRATSTGYSATALKIIVDDVNQLSHEDRAFVVPDVVTALKQSVEDDIEMTQASAVAGSLDVMIQWWARKCESQVRHLQVYREYAAALKAYVARLPPSKPKMHIERQLDALTSSVNAARSVRKQSAVNTRAQSPPTFNFSKLAGALERQPFAKRQTHLVWLLVAFKKDTISRINDKGERRVLKPMSKVFRWMFQYLREPYHVNACWVLVEAAQQASSRICGASANKSVIGLLDRMSAALTGPSSRETHKFLDDIHDQATNVLNRLKECKHIHVPDIEVNKLLVVVNELVEHTAYEWDARQDLTTQECVKELKNIVVKTSQRKPQCSRELLGAIAKWKIDAPPRS